MASRTVNIIVRYAVASVGLFMIAFAIALAIKSNLGTAPLSCMAYVLNLDMPGISVGTFTFLVNMLYILIQLAVLRRRFKAVHLMQVVASVLFGYMIDAGLWALGWVDCSAYWQLWLLVAAGIVLLGIGVAFAVASGAVPLAGEAMVVAVCRVLHSSFPRTKIIFDVCLVVSALALSFAVAGKIEGVREGTLAAALCVGLTVKAANKFVVPMAKRFIA